MAKNRRGKEQFGGYIALYLVLFGLTLTFASFYLFWSNEEHDREYAQLMSAMDSKSPVESKKHPRIHQSRENVRKEILHTSKGERLSIRIDCDQSDLALEPQDGKSEIVELMKGVNCCMQEKVSAHPPTQTIKQFDAEEAVYWFKADRFHADQVNLTRFVSSGNSLDALGKEVTPLLDGIAESVEFSPAGTSNGFKAAKIKLTVHHQGIKG